MGDTSPNILFITCHDLGRHLGCYGNPTVVSPALDGLASQGVRFENAFCTAPTCCPSRAALHTGRYPHSTGMLGFLFEPFNWILKASERHTAGHLKEHGYQTAQIGFQHVVKSERQDLLQALGFDFLSQLESKATAQQVADEACKYLEDYKANEPFYLEVGFFEAHTRWDQYPLVGWGETELSKGVQVPPFLPDVRATRAQLAGFQGAIRQLDEGVGRILSTLDVTGRTDNTWVIFVTDHGMPFPGSKGTLYEAGIEIAMIMRWPKAGLVGGKVVSQLTSNVDIVPTLLEAVGIPIPDTIEGRSFWPLLENKPYSERKEVFAEHTFGIHYEPMRCIRTVNHKLIFTPEMSSSLGSETDGVYSEAFQESLTTRPYFTRSPFEFYDFQDDPLERNNLANYDDGNYHEIEQDLKARLRAWMEKTNDPLLKGPIASPRYREAISSLISAT